MKRDKLQSRFGVLSPTALSLGTVLCLGLVWGQAAQQTGPSSFTIGGDLASPLTLKAEDLAQMSRETVSVPDPDGTNVEYEGVLVREILKRAGGSAGKRIARQGAGELPSRKGARRLRSSVHPR